ncbi:MAG: hypothetical protein ABSC51_06430 [Gaiellaceae bacterium]|jgi:hypothetical protein
MQIRAQLSLDSDGYLRRQCPRCERVFKWHDGPIGEVPADAPEPGVYYCPYCGEPSPLDQWFTDEQVDYLQALAMGEVTRLVESELGPVVDDLNRSGDFISASLEVPTDNPPPPLLEPDDMIAVASPCHPHEPVKILDDWDQPIHCLVCGEPFTVSMSQ